MKSKLAVIIVNYNTRELTLACLASIAKAKGEFDVYVVDNGSTDGSVKAIRNFQIIQSLKNLGFAGGNNLALNKIQGNYQYQYYLLLNSDTIINSDTLEKLVKTAEENGYGIMSCKLVDKTGRLQPNAGELPTILPILMWLTGFDDLFRSVASYQARDENKYHGTKEFGWVSGTAMLINNDVLKKIGILDEKIFMYVEDVDYCWRAYSAGFSIGWTDNCSLYHMGGGSSVDPKYKQWLGEFRGLLYLYNKYYGWGARLGLKMLMYLFISLRSLAFLLLGRVNYAKAYAKILISL